MLKDILIVAPFVALPGEPLFNRFLYLAQMWATEFRVTLVTSRFSFALKRQRDVNDERWRALPFKLVMLEEPGYRKNVSFARVLSHKRFVEQLRAWLARREADWTHDLVFSAYPLIATNLVLAKLKRRLGFRLIIDVQDVWPESIAAVFPFLGKHRWPMWPLTLKANRAYQSADGLVAVSETYLARARRTCPEVPGLSVFIGSDRQMTDAIPATPLPPGRFRLIYLGTLSHSYDISTLIRGVRQLRQHHPELELHILGDSTNMPRIRDECGDGIFYHGLLPYDQMVAFAKSCDLAVNPIVESGLQSVTNKISDYFTLGLPILSSQRNPEAAELIRRGGGEKYDAGSVPSFCEGLSRILRKDLQEVKKQTRQIGTEFFDRQRTYPRITSFVRDICDRK